MIPPWPSHMSIIELVTYVIETLLNRKRRGVKIPKMKRLHMCLSLSMWVRVYVSRGAYRKNTICKKIIQPVLSLIFCEADQKEANFSAGARNKTSQKFVKSGKKTILFVNMPSENIGTHRR